MEIPGEDNEAGIGDNREDDGNGNTTQPYRHLSRPANHKISRQNDKEWKIFLPEILDCEISLNHCLIDSVYCHPSKVSAHRLRPEGVSCQQRRIQIEYLDPVMVVTHVKHLPRPAHQALAHDDHDEAGEQHAEGLEHVGPDDGLDPPEAGVEDADTEGDQDRDVHVETRHL